MTADTTDPSYWLNWRFLVCAIWILSTIVAASILIWKYEGFKKSTTGRRTKDEQEAVGALYEGEVWKTCLKGIHPAWLLAYRVIAFFVMLGLIVANVALDGGGIFYYYTQWTFALVTFYFGFGSSVSLCGIYKHRNRIGEDEERGAYVAPTLGESGNTFSGSKRLTHEEYPGREGAGACEYIFQIIYQMCGGAAVLTDCVYWLILSKSDTLDFMLVSMHSVNAVFLLGEAVLNNMRFPLFRIAYFVLWTGAFVIFQWIFHAFKSMAWPYSFLDLSSSYAPLWYIGIGLMHLPCYGFFAFIIRMKNLLLSRAFPESYQSER
ncbi:unnamed protein product [Malus baccata var. baccata]